MASQEKFAYQIAAKMSGIFKMFAIWNSSQKINFSISGRKAYVNLFTSILRSVVFPPMTNVRPARDHFGLAVPL